MSDTSFTTDKHTKFEYGRGDAYAHYARNNYLLKPINGRSEAVLLSDNLAAASAYLQHQQREADAAAARAAAGWAVTPLELFLGVLLLLALLQSLWLVARWLYSFRLQQLEASRTKGNLPPLSWPMQQLSFLAPTPKQTTEQPQTRAPVLFGVVMGIVSLLIVQWLLSPAVVAAMWGTSSSSSTHAPQRVASAVTTAATATAAAPSEGAHSNVAGRVPLSLSVSSESLCPACEECKHAACPPAASARHHHQLSDDDRRSACHRISDPSPSSSISLYEQHAWKPFPLQRIACPDWATRGRWVPREGMDVNEPKTWPAWAGGEHSNPEHFLLQWQPPADCAVDTHSNAVWSRFDAELFLQSLSGRTLAFLGDSLVRQQFDNLLLLLHGHIVTSTNFYPSHTQGQLDNSVREVHCAYNVTLKSQMLRDGVGDGSGTARKLVEQVYPTIWRSDVLVLNVDGLWPSGAGSEQDFAASLRHLLAWSREHYAGSLLWREHSPAHYDTRDGEEHPDEQAKKHKHTHTQSQQQLPLCKSLPPAAAQGDFSGEEQRFAHFRLKLANEIMGGEGTDGAAAAAAVMGVFNSTLTLPDAAAHHPGSGDCRHWPADSSVFEHWAEVLFNMVVPR